MLDQFQKEDNYSKEIQKLRYAGDLLGAIEKCKEAIALFPQDNFFHKILSDIYLRIGKTREAAEEQLANLRLISDANSKLFRNFIRFFRIYERQVDEISITDYKAQIRAAIANNEFSGKIVDCLVEFFGNDILSDPELTQIIPLLDNDKHYGEVMSKLSRWSNEANITNIRGLISYRISSKENGASKRIDGALIRYAEKHGLYREAMALIEKYIAIAPKNEIIWKALRIGRQLDDYSIVEKSLTLSDELIDHSDFNILYELVYYYQKQRDFELLDKTLQAMRKSAQQSIPIARTLYNFYLSFERFDEAQEVYSHLQTLLAEQKQAQVKKRQVEQQETEQAVWLKLKNLVSEQEHNRQLAALRDLLKGFSHELGQPITNIRYAVQLYQMKIERGIDTSESLKELLNGILTQTTRIGSLLSRFRPIVSSNSKEENFSIKACIENVLKDLEVRLRNRNIEYIIEGDRTICIVGDSVQFSQVFYNLVLNSMQAMENNGLIKVSLRQERNQILIHFSDNGPGIAPEYHQRIFEPFFSTKEPSSENGGEGLGLFIVWNIVKMFNGTIGIDGRYRNGAKFIIKLPIQEDQKNEPRIDN